MGFPVVYPEMMLPKFLAHFLLLLGYLRRLLTWALDIFGLADLLLLDAHEIPSSSTLLVPRTHHRQPPHKPLFSVLIQAALPVTNYASSSSSSSSSFCMEERDDVCCYCAICLHEFSPGEEVRPLANCRHVFHRCCLDPWVELDQKTCPLCRTPLVPEWAKDEMDRKLRAQTPPVAAAAATTISTSSSYLYDDNGDLYDDPLGFFVQPSTAVPL